MAFRKMAQFKECSLEYISPTAPGTFSFSTDMPGNHIALRSGTHVLPATNVDKTPNTITFPLVDANGAPLETRALWQAYTWILASIVLSIPFIRPSGAQIKDSLGVWIKRAPRPVFSAAIFFAIGEIMNMSGYSMSAKAFAVPSMVKVLAEYSSDFFSGAYGAVVTSIGLFGGFITGSEASTIAMFGKYTLTTAKNLNMETYGMILIMAGLAFGGGLASVISPAKLQNAAASIDKLGAENQVIRTAFVFSILLTVVTSLFLVLLLAIN